MPDRKDTGDEPGDEPGHRHGSHGGEHHPARPTELRPTGAPAAAPATTTQTPPGGPYGPPNAVTGARATLRRPLAHATGPAHARIARVRAISAEGLLQGRVVGPAIAQVVGLRPRDRAEAGHVGLVLVALIALIVFFLRVTWMRFLESDTPGRIVTGALGVATTGALVLFVISLFAHVLPVLLLGRRGQTDPTRSDTP